MTFTEMRRPIFAFTAGTNRPPATVYSTAAVHLHAPPPHLPEPPLTDLIGFPQVAMHVLTQTSTRSKLEPSTSTQEIPFLQMARLLSLGPSHCRTRHNF